ncbi:MAG TPA: hypothetical protein GX391_06755 [Firmicutes bacterium]|nr:hypothetical protein [Bacillota bacterium]HOQ24398.1 hypothetical protein [Bacillota bacterium]HPT67707.1 hypothetical protein [Bacillota bacterium]
MRMVTAFWSSGPAIRFIKKLISGGHASAPISFIGDCRASFGELVNLLDNCAILTLPEGRALLVVGALASRAALVTGGSFAGLFVNYALLPGEREQLVRWARAGNSLVILDDRLVPVGPAPAAGKPAPLLWAWPEQDLGETVLGAGGCGGTAEQR